MLMARFVGDEGRGGRGDLNNTQHLRPSTVCIYSQQLERNGQMAQIDLLAIFDSDTQI